MIENADAMTRIIEGIYGRLSEADLALAAGASIRTSRPLAKRSTDAEQRQEHWGNVEIYQNGIRILSVASGAFLRLESAQAS